MKTLLEQKTTAILSPSDDGWDDARKAWNLAVDQRPAGIARPASAAEVVDAVNFARRGGLRVAAQGTGHNAGPLGPLDRALLIKTDRLRGVSIDARARIARVQAGELWLPVVTAAAEHGLTALAGSSPDVGVVGYTLGGGLSFLGRAYGLSANNVEAIDVVLADGRLVRADASTEPDLFWALRGGGGSFGVVTAIELRLFPITEVYAGLLLWPLAAADEILTAWRELTAIGLPDEFTTTFRLIRIPAQGSFPEPLRGRKFVLVDVIHLGEPSEADALLAPLRDLRPVIDTIAPISLPALSHLHLEPEHPEPVFMDGFMLAGLPEAAADELLRVAGPAADLPLPAVELRHLGGELRRPRPGNGALAALDAEYFGLAVGPAAPDVTPELAATVRAGVRGVQAAMRPWAASQTYLNFAGTSRDPASFWSPQAYGRLRQIKASVDPHDLIMSNHPIPPATGC
jgi:hypothetical protein